MINKYFKYSILSKFQQIALLFLVGFFLFTKHIHAQENQAEIEQLKNSLTTKHDTAKINTQNALAFGLRKSAPNEALEYANEALVQSTKIKYSEGQAAANKNIGSINWGIGNYDEALKYLQISLSQYDKLQNQTEIATIYNLLGLVYWNTGDHQLAHDHYTKAFNIFKEINDTSGIIKCFSNQGILYMEEGNLDKALEYYLHALEINEKQAAKLSSATILTNIGIVYVKQEKYQQALEYYNKSKNIYLQVENKSGLANALSNIGSCFFKMQNLDSSLVYHQQALSIYLELGNKKGLGETYNSIGSIYIEQQKLNEAITELKKALETRKEIGDKRGEMVTYFNFGVVYKKKNMFEEAINYFNLSLPIASNIQSTENLSKINNELSQTYFYLKDYQKAYEYYQQHIVYKDSIYNKESNDKLLALETQYETTKKEKEIELLNKEALIKEARLKIYFLLITFVVIISGMILLLQVIRSKKNKKILLSEIKSREQELTFNKQILLEYTQNLLEKQHIVEELSTTIESIQNKPQEKAAQKENIHQLTTFKIITDDDWEKFKQLFEKVHKGFFYELKNKYPDITTSESILAALIKINLSSKEISSMIGISIESVKKSRQRLRKKMQLQPEDDLEKRIDEI